MSFEHVSLSSLRATRTVRPTQEAEPGGESLKSALYAAEQLCRQFDPDPKLADAKFYTAESLRVVLFERRAKTAVNINNTLQKMYNRLAPDVVNCARRFDEASGRVVRKRKNTLPATLREIQQIKTQTDGPLLGRATSLVARQHEDRPYLGTEISLVLGEGDAPEVLEAQSETIYSIVKNQKGYGKLPRTVHDPSRSKEVAIFHFPFRSEPEADDFIDLFSPQIIVHGLTIHDPVKYSLNITPDPSVHDDFND